MAVLLVVISVCCPTRSPKFGRTDGSASTSTTWKWMLPTKTVLALLRSTVLYNQVFASRFVLSPPSSPSANGSGEEAETDVVLLLRRVLGSSVFEESGESNSDGLSLEDARDRVVDMIVNMQRERRTRVG
ncbi:hypothetical protein JVU11DRAFT_7929 [Chiua virens]|nr:hypothetical protein JVU11DRAFT_7929 [Chiua virens]